MRQSKSESSLIDVGKSASGPLNSLQTSALNVYDALLSKVLEEDQNILGFRPRLHLSRPEDREETEVARSEEEISGLSSRLPSRRVSRQRHAKESQA